MMEQVRIGECMLHLTETEVNVMFPDISKEEKMFSCSKDKHSEFIDGIRRLLQFDGLVGMDVVDVHDAILSCGKNKFQVIEGDLKDWSNKKQKVVIENDGIALVEGNISSADTVDILQCYLVQFHNNEQMEEGRFRMWIWN